MGDSYKRLRERVDQYEVETCELRKAIASAVEDGSLHPAAAGAELIARAIRGGGSEVYRKALGEVGVDYPSREAMEKVRKARLAAEDAAPPEDLHDMTAVIRKAAGKD